MIYMFNYFQIIEVKKNKHLEFCRSIRKEVFINEQGVDPKIELDSKDAACEHILALYKDEPIATARLLRVTEQKYKVGRMAVKKKFRRSGIGSKILQFIENHLKNNNVKFIELNAQKYVEEFYLKNGYAPIGNDFYEADILHIKMQKNIL